MVIPKEYKQKREMKINIVKQHYFIDVNVLQS